MKLTNLKITPKLGILVGVTLLGLCVAGLLAGYLMQREMLNARIEQTRAIVDMARNMALGLQKQVEAGQMTKEAAIAEFSKRGNTLTFDKGNGYVFAYTMDGVAVLAPVPGQIGQNRMDIDTGGRKLVRELRDGIAANGEIMLRYEFRKPGEEARLIRKFSYAVPIPGWNMFVGTGAYLDDLDTKMKPIAAVLGLAILGIALVAGSIAWMIGRSISKPLSQLGTRMQDLAEGRLDGEIPGIGRGDEIGAMAATVQIFKDNAVRIRGLEQKEAEVQARAEAERRAAMESIASDFERSVTGIVRTVSTAAAGMQTTAQSMTATASDASARAATVGAASQRSSDNVGTVASAAEELSSSVTEISRQVARSSEIASKAVSDAERTNATVGALSTGAEKIGEVVKLIHSIAGSNQFAGAQRHHRGGARRQFRPRFCGRGVGSEGARQPDREGDRGNLVAGRGHAGFDQRSRGLDRRHHRNHLADERDHGFDLDRRRAAGRRYPRDRPQHSVGGGRIERDLHPYRRRHHGGGGDRQGGVRGAGERPRTRHPVRHAAQRGRRIFGQGAGGVSGGTQVLRWAKRSVPTIHQRVSARMVGTLRFAHPTSASPGYSQGQSGNTNLFHIKSQSNELTSR